MIDDVVKATALADKMNASVPIPARPTRQVVDLLRSKGVSLGREPTLEIKKVYYMGDEGGICCDVTPAGSREAVVCSVTHLRVHPKHPLAGEIRAYQQTGPPAGTRDRRSRRHDLRAQEKQSLGRQESSELAYRPAGLVLGLTRRAAGGSEADPVVAQRHGEGAMIGERP